MLSLPPQMPKVFTTEELERRGLWPIKKPKPIKTKES